MGEMSENQNTLLDFQGIRINQSLGQQLPLLSDLSLSWIKAPVHRADDLFAPTLIANVVLQKSGMRTRSAGGLGGFASSRPGRRQGGGLPAPA